MTRSLLPRGYDDYITRGPSERDMDAETEERNRRADERYQAMVDDEDREANA